MDLRGIIVPLITPFTDDNRLDTAGLARLTEHYIAEGAGGLVVCSTSGEAASLAHDEYLAAVRTVVETAHQRLPVLAGTGSSDTAKSVIMTREVERLGVDGALVVTPFYSNPGPEGLFLHFRSVAQATRLKVYLYSVPDIGVSFDLETVLRLAEIQNIAGIVDRGTDFRFFSGLIMRAPHDFTVISGNPDTVFAAACLGAHGAMCPSAGVSTASFVRLFDLISRGELPEARKLYAKMAPLVEVLHSEPNPAPIKAALQILEMPGGAPRLPVAPASIKCRTALREILLTAEHQEAGAAKE